MTLSTLRHIENHNGRLQSALDTYLELWRAVDWARLSSRAGPSTPPITGAHSSPSLVVSIEMLGVTASPPSTDSTASVTFGAPLTAHAAAWIASLSAGHVVAN